MGKPTGFLEYERETSIEIAPEERIKNFFGFWHIYLNKESITRDPFITEETARKMYRDYFSQINDLFVVALQKRGKTIAEQLFAYPKVWMEIYKP